MCRAAGTPGWQLPSPVAVALLEAGLTENAPGSLAVPVASYGGRHLRLMVDEISSDRGRWGVARR